MSRGKIDCRKLDTSPSRSNNCEWQVTWKTRNFYKLCVGRVGQSIVSPVFKLKQNEALIYLCPESLKANRNSNKRRITFSIYLQIVKKTSFPLEGSVTFELVKPVLPLGEAKISEATYVANCGWGFQRSFYRKPFSKEGWPTTILSCKISLAKKSFFKQPSWFTDPASTNSPKLATDLATLLENGNFYDVTIKVGERKLKAHKSILTVRSPVFAAMLNTDMLESSSSEINVLNVEFDVMQMLLEFIYTGKVGNTSSATPMPMEELMVAADMYQMGDLKKACGEILTVNINTENVIRYLYLAYKFSLGHLFRSAVQFVNFNWDVVGVSEEWTELLKSSSDLAFFILSTLDDDQYYKNFNCMESY